MVNRPNQLRKEYQPSKRKRIQTLILKRCLKTRKSNKREVIKRWTSNLMMSLILIKRKTSRAKTHFKVNRTLTSLK